MTVGVCSLRMKVRMSKLIYRPRTSGWWGGTPARSGWWEGGTLARSGWCGGGVPQTGLDGRGLPHSFVAKKQNWDETRKSCCVNARGILPAA